MIKFRKQTPEEKLLHIIEKPEEMDRLNIKKRGKKGILPISKLVKIPFINNIDFKKITLHGINKTLISISAVVTIALILYFIKGERLSQIRLAHIKQKNVGTDFQIDIKKKDIPDLSSYISETETNNPFHVLPFIGKDKSVEIEEKIELQLVGIIWSDNPQAIIEDTVSKKNYLVNKGDTIDKFTVKDITQAEVRITSKDGNKTLR